MDQLVKSQLGNFKKNKNKAAEDNRSMHWVPLALFLVLSGWIWAIAFIERPTDGVWWTTMCRAIIFAPAGAWLRYYLSLYNKFAPGVKWFTLIPNVVASTVDAVLGNYSCNTTNTCSTWTTGFQTGFNGSLSTYSTYVNELQGM